MDINEREFLFNTKFLHQTKSTESLQTINILLLIIYYICILVIIYILIVKYDFNKYGKLVVSILLLLYPFIVYYIEDTIYNFSQYISAFITGTTFDE